MFELFGRKDAKNKKPIRPRYGTYSDIWDTPAVPPKKKPPLLKSRLPQPKRPKSHEFNSNYFQYESHQVPEKKHTRRNRMRLAVFLGLLGATGAVSLGFLLNQDSQRGNTSIDQAARDSLSGTGGILVTAESTPEAASTQEASLTPTEIQPSSTPLPTETPPRQVRNAWQRDRTPTPITPEAQPTLEPTLATPTPAPEITGVVSTPEPAEELLERRTILNGFTVYLNAEGIPTGYNDPRSHERITFSEDEIAALVIAQQQAVDSGLPAISLDLHSLPQGEISSPEPPKTELEVPTDTVSPETLSEQYGITIFNSSNVSLDIRESAFESGGILEYQRQYVSETGVQLWVVLIDDFIVSSRNLDESVPQYLKDLLPAEEIDVAAYRQQMIEYLQTQIAEDEQYYTGEDFESSFLVTSYRELQYYQTASDDELRLQLQQSSTEDAAGRYFRPNGYYVNGETVFASVVFVAVGEVPESRTDRSVPFFYFTPEGEPRISNPAQMITLRPSFSPRPENSYPRVEDFDYRDEDDPRGYIIGAQVGQPGVTLNHELEHHMLITVAPRLLGTQPNYSENETDRETINRLSLAGQTLDQGSSRGYPFIFRGPHGTQVTKAMPNS